MQEIIEKIDHIGFYIEGAIHATVSENPAFDVFVKLLSKFEDLKDFVIDEFESNEESFPEPLPECHII